ncbi:cell division protein ZipN/Ftn2/Arc6, specific for cyanobacteria and chloroplast [Pseudanabaena sp. lw0831]|uniref:ARC6/PARC6 family protein n=1 Tax=Pseudanabaena sp. lw0831 TaxID=1357935 RepID=UPI0019154202|nr:IMS domain-containing protein [Pseudanabaena sp. lw0831]GBO53592.1 cell division protein ZipN/Ftn2/Arc6, specific for cyanobacteria and chloroplast [Pseudanabaena sp. lw0831]
MRVPLDCYRILGLTHLSGLDKVHQAHRDRLLSMPRREYSDAAIASRKRIIDKAYETLTERDRHSAATESDALETDSDRPVLTLPPQIEADEKDFAGLLLILYELGESEKVLSLAKPYYDPEEAEYQSARISPHDPDLLLSVSLSYLDIGREYWKQGQYESAASSLESAQEILLREGLFLSIRSEIQADLFRLRPYRILELLASPDNHTEAHRKGMSLLQEMLDARRGIDGSGNDYSSLGIDDFLRFIQQLRSYMTAIEQQTLFEEEARRPSSVATYLAVYALIARGFSQRQPALIRRAKGLLVKLSAKQDIYLEKAVCALLLGQTEEASAAIDQSGEDDQIAFIRQNSEGAPDLLPGLCLYSERWMQEEVYPHFRDLMSQIVSLKDYFADEQVQAYLEELPNTGAMSSEWTSPVGGDRLTAISSLDESPNVNRDFDLNPAKSAVAEPKLSTYAPEIPNRFQRSAATPVIERHAAHVNTNVSGNVTRDLPSSRRTSNVPPARNSTRAANEFVREIKRPSQVHTSSHASLPKRKFNVGRLATVIVLAIAVLAGSIWLVVWAVRALTGTPQPQPITLEKPITNLVQALKENNVAPVAQPGPLDKETATKVIESWQATKSKALGKGYEDNLLEEILIDPALSDWKGRAKELKASNSYLQYQTKSSVVDSVTPDGDSKAKVVAKISESRNYFNNGELDRGASKDDASYTVEYDLVKKDNRWLIREMLVF